MYSYFPLYDWFVPIDWLTDKEKVEDENDSVDCTVPAGVLYSTCCHFVPAMESDSDSNKESKSNPSHEGVALTHKTKTNRRRNLFMARIIAVLTLTRIKQKESVGLL